MLHVASTQRSDYHYHISVVRLINTARLDGWQGIVFTRQWVLSLLFFIDKRNSGVRFT